MTVAINITNSWPATLPLPLIDYAGTAQVPTVVSPENSARVKRRSRFTAVYATLSVSWRFNPVQYKAFLSFWDTTLGAGVAKFSMELRYPKISTLDTWIVQFLGDLQVNKIENVFYEVETVLLVHTPTVLTTAVAASMEYEDEIEMLYEDGEVMLFE